MSGKQHRASRDATDEELVALGVPEDMAKRINAARHEFTGEVISRGYPTDKPLSPEQSEECKKLASDIFLKYGFTVSIIDGTVTDGVEGVING